MNESYFELNADTAEISSENKTLVSNISKQNVGQVLMTWNVSKLHPPCNPAAMPPKLNTYPNMLNDLNVNIGPISQWWTLRVFEGSQPFDMSASDIIYVYYIEQGQKQSGSTSGTTTYTTS